MPRSGLDREGVHLEHFAFDGQNVAGARWFRPGDFPAAADYASREGRGLADEQFHGDGRDMPAARRQAAEKRVLRRLFVEMEGLRIELFRESLDLLGFDAMGTGGEAPPGRDVVEIEIIAVCHFRLHVTFILIVTPRGILARRNGFQMKRTVFGEMQWRRFARALRGAL